MRNRNGTARHRKARLSFLFRPHLEALEERWNPSLPAPPDGIPLSLEIVALHEFGHALGLSHITDGPSIMNPVYNPDFNIDYFLSGADPAIAVLQALYSPENVASGNTPWKDSSDGSPGDNIVQITYSFMQDGSGSTLFETLTMQFVGTSWVGMLESQFALWAAASGGTISFSVGEPGDIHIGGSSMDGPGGTLAYGYSPGGGSGGSVMFDMDENWTGVYTRASGDGDGGDDHDLGGGEPLMAPRGFLPILVHVDVRSISPEPAVAQPDLRALAEAARQVRTITITTDLPGAGALQVRVEAFGPIQEIVSATRTVGWGQPTAADLYKVVFLPVLPAGLGAEEAEAIPDLFSPQTPADGAVVRADASGPATNDPGVQTQTLQIPQSSREESQDEAESAAWSVFDSGTALAGLALVMGGYWVVPQEEKQKKPSL